MTDAQKQLDRELALAAGLDEQEADCWVAVAEAASQFLRLPESHPMDAQEGCSAFHVVQDKLMKRAAYRRYLQAARERAGGPAPNSPQGGTA